MSETENESGTNARSSPRDRSGPPSLGAASPPAFVSVVVTTYERPDALAAVLEGLAAQRDTAFETVIGDDGSGGATADVIDAIHARSGLPIVHVRHEDRGFRAAAVRNRAIAASRGDYVLFLDGDCVPRPDWIAIHRRVARPGAMTRGSRALLSPAETARVLERREPVHARPLASWLAARVRGGVNRLDFVLPGLAGSGGGRAGWESVRTCHLAAWRCDLIAVDGFDERYEGWGYEDSDLAIRLANLGVEIRRAPRSTTVAHLWHDENDRRLEGENRARLDALRVSDRTRAERGLSRADASDLVVRRLGEVASSS